MPPRQQRGGKMATLSKSMEAKRQQLAAALDCMTSEEWRALAGITEKTEEAHRKRHTGPAYILVGTQYLYPRKAVAEFLKQNVREPNRTPAKALL